MALGAQLQSSDTGVTIVLTDASRLALFCTGSVAFTTLTTAGIYQKGCLYVDTDIAAATAGLYANKGSTAVPAFTLVTQA